MPGAGGENASFRAHIPTPCRETSAGFGKAGPVIKNFAAQPIFTSLPFFLSVIQSDIKYVLDVVEAHISKTFLPWVLLAEVAMSNLSVHRDPSLGR